MGNKVTIFPFGCLFHGFVIVNIYFAVLNTLLTGYHNPQTTASCCAGLWPDLKTAPLKDKI